MSESHLQSIWVEHINRAMAQIDQVTHRNAALVEDAVATASSLRDQAGMLVELVVCSRLDGATVQRLGKGSDAVSGRAVAMQTITSVPSEEFVVAKHAEAQGDLQWEPI